MTNLEIFNQSNSFPECAILVLMEELSRTVSPKTRVDKTTIAESVGRVHRASGRYFGSATLF